LIRLLLRRLPALSTSLSTAATLAGSGLAGATPLLLWSPLNPSNHEKNACLDPAPAPSSSATKNTRSVSSLGIYRRLGDSCMPMIAPSRVSYLVADPRASGDAGASRSAPLRLRFGERRVPAELPATFARKRLLVSLSRRDGSSRWTPHPHSLDGIARLRARTRARARRSDPIGRRVRAVSTGPHR